jgi:very-short-patch-repair endonuclease
MRHKKPVQPAAEVAAVQHGVIAARQLTAIGYSRRKISREVAAGRLHRLHQGVFALGHPAVSAHGRCMAAVLAGGDGALLSHHSAAWLWGISTRVPARFEITSAVELHDRAGLVQHSAATLHQSDSAVVDGIPLTAVPRTLLDLAAADRGNLRWALPRARRLGLVDLVEIDSLLRRSVGLRGVGRLRAAIEIHRQPDFTRSELERRFLKAVKRAGLPRPSMNRFVAGFELDAYWPKLRFAVELDTYDHHGDEDSFEADRLRQEDLKLAGIEMTRVTGRRLDREPSAVISRLRRLLSDRTQELATLG